MEYLFLGIDSVICGTLYYFFRKKSTTLTNIKKAVELDLNDPQAELPDVIEYGMVVGVVKPDKNDLVSYYNSDYHGVIRVHEIKEHGTRFTNNITSDTTRVISKDVNDVPFSLIQYANVGFKPLKIQVDNPLEADYLFENFFLCYKKFEPTKESLVSRVVSAVVAKETTKGIEVSEHMLTNGTQLTGFGRLEKVATNAVASKWLPKAYQAEYRLCKPGLKDHSFILTSMGQPALVDHLKRVTRWLKVSLIIFGSLGALVGIYCLYRNVKKYIRKKRRDFEINKARIQRLKNRRNRSRPTSAESPGEEVSEHNACVICLVNPRELVLLDCGHVCLCMDCLEKMPNNNCPVCRAGYRTFAPIYMP